MRIVVTALVAAAWLALAIAGVMLPSAPYRDAIATPGQASVGAVAMFTVTYTYSNIALLAALAGGGAALLRRVARPNLRLAELMRLKLFASGGLRGACVAGLMTLTSLIIQPQLYTSVTQGQYLALALVANVLAVLLSLRVETLIADEEIVLGWFDLPEMVRRSWSRAAMRDVVPSSGAVPAVAGDPRPAGTGAANGDSPRRGLVTRAMALDTRLGSTVTYVCLALAGGLFAVGAGCMVAGYAGKVELDLAVVGKVSTDVPGVALVVVAALLAFKVLGTVSGQVEKEAHAS